MRLIDADALMKAMYHRAFETDGDTMWQSGCWVRYRAIEQTVKKQPTIEERKKGKWIVNTYEHAREFWDRETTCSVCGYKMGGGTPNYCPNCGADMRGEEHGRHL